MQSNKRVSYFFDPRIGTYHYSNTHPMKPLRVAMADDLINQYGLYSKMKVYVSNYFHFHFSKNSDFIKISDAELRTYHADNYVDMIMKLTPENKNLYEDQLPNCKINQIFQNDSQFW